MRLALLTDIHEHVELVRFALAHFHRERVVHVVVNRNVFEMEEQIEETCRLLVEAGTVSVGES
jgi:hypothetical protein